MQNRDALHGWLEQAFGRSLEAVVDNLAMTMAFLKPRVEAVLRLTDSTQL